MIFKRQQHDGLWAVINRQGFKTIIFERGVYETTDREECQTLMDMGYLCEGEMPEELEEYPVTIMGDIPDAPETKSFEVWKIDGQRASKVFDSKKEAEDWILSRDNWEDYEVR